MIADNLHDFLLASVGASASFIGLLFVALTLVLGRMPTGSALAGRDRALANSAYTALITVFLISMVGLIPDVNLAWPMVAMSWLGIGSSLRLSRSQRLEHQRFRRERPTVVGALTSLYLALGIFGVYSAFQPDKQIHSGVLLTILLVFYVTALGRAWALIGAEPLPDHDHDRKPHADRAEK